MPCPWFPEMADYAKSHPDADFGLHLTITSERVYYRWGPVAPQKKCPAFWMKTDISITIGNITSTSNAKDVEIELRAQIERALAMGVRPTHLGFPSVPADHEWQRNIRRVAYGWLMNTSCPFSLPEIGSLSIRIYRKVWVRETS